MTGSQDPRAPGAGSSPRLPERAGVSTNCSTPSAMPKAGSANPKRQPNQAAKNGTASDPRKAPRLMPM